MNATARNVQGRVQRLEEQVERSVDAGPDLICLQEVTASTQARWERLLVAAGWPDVVVAWPSPPSRRAAAVRCSPPPRRDAHRPGSRFPELCGRSACSPPISPKPELAKVRTHEAVFQHLAAGSSPRLVCGDFNTPRKEHPDGRVWTFARTRAGRLRPDRGERWDLADLALIKGLEPHGFRDAFRDLHGPQAGN